jgi:transcriptional regulator with GAF, ATPase, and Fis domain/tetratricopeptide (TPR) repeat protein
MSNVRKTPIAGSNVWKTLSESEKKILVLLAHLTPPVSIDTLMSLSEFGVLDILNIMESLNEKKIVFEKKETGKGLYFPKETDFADLYQADIPGEELQDTLRRIIDFHLRSPDQGQKTTRALADLYMLAGDSAEGLSYIKRAADSLYRSGLREKAIRYYEYIIKSYSETVPGPEKDSEYLDSVYNRVAMDMFYAIPFQTSIDLLERALWVAKQNKHSQYIACISLLLAHRLIANGHTNRGFKHIHDFQKLAEKIHDDRLKRTSALLMSATLVTKGVLSNATDYYERMTGGLEEFGNTDVDLVTTLMIASSHVSCGRISRGLGMIDVVRTIAKSSNFLEGVCLAELAMAIALIEIRKPTEAQPVLERIRLSAFPEDVLDSLVLAIYPKCKAYVLCAKEDFEGAFEHLKLSHMHMTSAGSAPSRYFWPWALECLHTLESKGYSDDKMNLDTEIREIVAWDNPYMKGAALRYRALRNIEKKRSEKTIVEDLKLSEKLLKQVGAAIELARTRVVLGNYHIMKGRTARGKSHHRKALHLLAEIDENLIPKDLLATLPWEQKIDIIIDRITAMNKSFGTATEESTFLERAINAGMDFTMATLAAFLTLQEGDELELVAGRNIVSSHFEMDENLQLKEIIIDAIKKNREIVSIEGNEDFRRLGVTSFIGIPVTLGDHTYGLFVLDTHLNNTSLSEHSLPFARMLASQIALGLFNISNWERERELKERFEDEAIYYRRENRMDSPLNVIIGRSEGTLTVISQIEKVAPSDSSVLILGETGVGKELVAKGIHHLSVQKDGPYIPVNIASLPRDLVASELFGHEKGAFTGASKKHKGRFELSDGGTIFLDEIGELPPDVQLKLLRVLQEGTFERLGSAMPIRSNFRVIAATNKDLQSEVQKGTFRQDLYYRLNVFPIYVPPLRERKEDILLLAQHFLDIFGKKMNKKIRRLPTDELIKLESYHWPGNVRELEHIIERAVILSPGREIRIEGLDPPSKRNDVEGPSIVPLAELERNHIVRALEATRWRISGPKGAAKLLGLNRSTLRYRMKKLGITDTSGEGH